MAGESFPEAVPLPGLAVVRQHNLLSPERLAALAGVHVGWVAAAEQGEGLAVPVAKALAKALRVRVNDLRPGSGLLI